MGTDWRGSVRGAGPVLLAALLVQALVVWIGARAYFSDRNTLAANGRWVSTKTELELGLMGARAFMEGRQSLAGGRLNLGAWHGFQEVLWKREVEDLRSLEFDFTLKHRGWVGAVLNHDGDQETYHVVRLSAPESDPSALLMVSRDGRFLEQYPLARESFPKNSPHRARIEISDSRLTVSVNGAEVGAFDYQSRARQRFGFRGGLTPLFVDNVVARFGRGEVARETFDSSRRIRQVTTAAVAALTLATLALFALLTRALDISSRHLGFYFLMISLALLVLSLLACSFVTRQSGRYPAGRNLQEHESVLRRAEIERARTAADHRFAALAGEDRYRILFVGSSQTRGAGARLRVETFVAQLEAKLERSRVGARRFACINGGASSTLARDLLPLLEHWLVAGRPDMVVINLSSNDRSSSPAEFGAAIRAMVESSIAAAAQPVLVKEANNYTDRLLRKRHEVLDLIAAEYGIPALDLQGFLQDAGSSGFLWWDKVHLTSHGQSLVAQRLHDELLPLIRSR